MGTPVTGPVSAGAATPVRVTVTGGSRRVDLVLPGAVPLAELIPELARSVGILDSRTVHCGYRLVTPAGRVLDPDCGLTVQGLEDGAFIAVVSGVDDGPPQVYDDVVEAMADVVDRDLDAWDTASRQRAALGAATLLLLAGAGATLTRLGSALAGRSAAGLAAVLVLAAIAHSRLSDETTAPVVVALTACAYTAVAGLVLAGRSPSGGMSVVFAGAGLLVSGVVAALGLARGRTLLLPPVMVGAVLVSTGLVIRASEADPAVVLTGTLCGVVNAAVAFPRLAVSATGTRVPPLFTLADLTRDPDPIDPARVSADVQLAHQLMVAMSATVGVLLVLLAPLAVSLGVAGTFVAALACLVVVLRTRLCSSRADVLVGLVSGALGLVSTASSVLWLHPGWRLPAAVALAASGAVWSAAILLPGLGRMRLGRAGDVVELLGLLALGPMLVIATGLFSWVQSQVG